MITFEKQSAVGLKWTSRRRGVTMIETAMTLGVTLLLLFGMLDLALVVFHYNTLSEGARRIARAAIVRGAKAPPQLNPWGPASYSGSAADGSEIAQAILPVLTTMEPEDVRIAVEWPDEGNGLDQRVEVTVSYIHESIVPFLFGRETFELSAASTMRIVH